MEFSMAAPARCALRSMRCRAPASSGSRIDGSKLDSSSFQDSSESLREVSFRFVEPDDSTAWATALMPVAAATFGGCVIVSCPRSNVWVGVGDPPLDDFYASGAPVALGTDSLASTDSLSNKPLNTSLSVLNFRNQAKSYTSRCNGSGQQQHGIRR